MFNSRNRRNEQRMINTNKCRAGVQNWNLNHAIVVSETDRITQEFSLARGNNASSYSPSPFHLSPVLSLFLLLSLSLPLSPLPLSRTTFNEGRNDIQSCNSCQVLIMCVASDYKELKAGKVIIIFA